MFQGLAKFGLYTKPDFTLGVVLAAVYCVLFMVSVLPAMSEINDTIGVVRLV